MLIVCNNCQTKYRVPDSAVGTKGKCPKCGAVLDIPADVGTHGDESGSAADVRAVDFGGDPSAPEAAASALADDNPAPSTSATSPDAGARAEEDPSQSATVVPDAAGTPQPATVPDSAAPLPATEDMYTFLAPPQAADEIGRLGAYRVLRVLGRGGMGVVFLAEDPRLGRQVALKAMLPEVANKPAARERFLREARTAAAIEHDHIVAIFQVDEDRGVPFIAMPLLKGSSLEDWLRTQHDRPLPVLLILKLGKQVAEGLAAAHAHGLIHRDIKPANIFLQSTARGASSAGKEHDLSATLSLIADAGPRSTDFRVKVLDFGLARSSAGDQHLTMSGVIMGTPAYMAPEQARSGSRVDGRADLFSLGVVLYRLCTGKLPFKGEDMMGTLMALAMDTPPSPASLNLELPLTLSDLVMHLLAKDPKDRVGSAEEVVKKLEAIEESYIAAAPTPTPNKGAPWGAQEVPVVYQAPVADPFKLTARELPTAFEHAPPPRPRQHVGEDAVEPEARPRHGRPSDDDEDRDDDLRDLRLRNEDTMLSMISMIVGIASAVLGVLACCCSPMGAIGAIGGVAAVVLGVMGHSRGGRNQAIAGISLGVVAILIGLVWLALIIMGVGMNIFGPRFGVK